MTKECRGCLPSSLVGHWWGIGHFLLFAALLGLWTWKLVSPNPVPDEVRARLTELDLAFVVAKTLHLGGYAVLAALAGTLPVPRRWRAFLVGLLALHGVATEVAQTFVPNRTGKASDVLIDWIGIALGALAARLWNHHRESRS
jgi:VanZ family protein